MYGTDLIRMERERQVTVEGWTPEHDDEHKTGDLSRAAACYAEHAANFMSHKHSLDVRAYRAVPAPDDWPWDEKWWKPKNPQHDLIRAGALIAAEIDRIDRLMGRKYAAAMSADDRPLSNADRLRMYAGWIKTGQPEMVDIDDLEMIADEIDDTDE